MKLKCQNCGNIWNYKGKSKYYATCTRCLKKIKVQEIQNGGVKDV